jgi:hypothetical protein
MAATETRFNSSDEAGRLLVERCRNDLTPMVDAIASVSSDTVRGKLLALMRANLSRRTIPGVLNAAQSRLETVEPKAAGGLLQILSAVGNDEAWRLLAGIVAQKENPKRDAAVDALRRWPNDRPLKTLEPILADTKGESEVTRRLALSALLPALEYATSRLPVAERSAPFKAREALAREFGLEREFIAAVGRTGSVDGMKILSAYVNDEDVGEEAVEALRVCGRQLAYEEMMPGVTSLRSLLRDVKDSDARQSLTELMEWIRNKHATTAPPVGEGNDVGDDDFGLDL